jgi:uncharacterized protein YbjQ (UPF0145 family)
MKKEDILITTSDNFTSSEIKAQYGVVDSQIVVGANLFRDVFSSFRDIFGGETKGYKKDINKMKKAALDSIKEQATDFGANAIISLRLDLDEVSGGGKSMFMLNAYGSAVELSENAITNQEQTNLNKKVSLDDIEFFKTRKNLKNDILEEDPRDLLVPRKNYLSEITEYNLWDKEIIEKVLDNISHASTHIREGFQEHINNIPPQRLESYLEFNFDQIESNLWEEIYTALQYNNWFNYDFLEHYLKDEDHIKRFKALQLCTIEKDFYRKEEIQKLQSLSEIIENELNTNIPTETKSGMMSEKEVYICPKCLNENKLDSNCTCGANKFGLFPKDLTPSKIADDLAETSLAIQKAVES